MAWSYRYRADDQLYADDEHGPTVFDPGATVGVPGSGNVIAVGLPTVGQLAIWTDPVHIAGQSLLQATNFPALTGDVTVVAGTTVTAYGNPVPIAKGGVPSGGGIGQVLQKNSGTNYDVAWVTFVGGGNVSNTGTPASGQLAIWSDATHVQGTTALPAANHPALAGDITCPAGSLTTTYSNAVPTTKGGLPTGGSSTQVLSKNTNTNYDTVWVTIPAGGNVGNSGAPVAGQLATWTDATHVQGVTVLPSNNHPALTGDVTVTSGTTVTVYNSAMPVAKGGVPPGGTLNQVLAKTSGSDFAVTWITPPGGGNVSAVPTPTSGQLAIWTGGTTVQGVTVLPAVNFPALTGDVTTSAGSLGTTIGNNVVTMAKMVDIVTDSILGRATAATGDPEVLTALPFAFTGDVTRAADSNSTAYNNPVPTSKAGLPAGGAANQVLSKVDATNYNTQWITAATGNVSNTGTPISGQLAIWTGSTIVQGVTALPGTNFPALTGDVTTAAGSLGTTIANNAVITAKISNANVTYAKIQNVSTFPRLLGRGSASTGPIEEIVLGTNLSMSGTTLNATGGVGVPGGLTTQLQFNNAGVFGGIPTTSWNGTILAFNNVSFGHTTVATSGGTINLNASSSRKYYFTGTLPHTVVLPDVTTLDEGFEFQFDNSSTGAITVNSFGGNLVATVVTNRAIVTTCILVTGTGATSWKVLQAAGGVDNTAFGASWNGVTGDAPSKDVLYDYLHLSDTNDNGKINVLDQGAGITVTDASGVLLTPLTAPAGAIVGTTDNQTLTNKTVDCNVNTVKVYTAQQSSSHTLTANECYNGITYITAAGVMTLPAVASGMKTKFFTVGNVLADVQPTGSDVIVLNGVALAAGHKARNNSTTGDWLEISFYEAGKWYGQSNAWIDGGTGTGGGGTPALIAHTGAQLGESGGTTPPINTAAANLIIVSLVQYWTTAATLTDSKGNTWTPLTSYTDGSATRIRPYFCFGTGIGDATHTFTVSGGSIYASLTVQAWSNIAASPLDQQVGTSSSSTTTLAPGSITPSQANTVVVSCYSDNDGLGRTVGIDSGFTISDTMNGSAGSSYGNSMAYKILTAATAQNPTWTSSVAQTQQVAEIASFKY